MAVTKILPYGATDSLGMTDEKDDQDLNLTNLIASTVTGVNVSEFFNDNKASAVPDTFMSIFRDIIFHQDKETDGVVRVESQMGGLNTDETAIKGVLHSYAPLNV